MEEYDIIEIPGKHGVIELHVPRKKSTKEEINEFYKSMAEVAINIGRNSKKEPAKK